ncbi:MAG TPA: hypothetical protein VGQ58_11525 [Candidatus Limnocylindrales bacterium]|jgi:hypothetical protein|nr:hypothetical protein [Candidatus Limnocylindrales bacterium]
MQTLVGLMVFVVLVVVGLLGLQAGGQVPQAIIILLSAGVGFAVWRAQENAKQARDLEEKFGSSKRVLYKAYIDIVREVVERGGNVKSDAYVPRLRRWVFGSLLTASDDVVLAHNRFLNVSRVGENVVIAAIADVILALRRDAGEEATYLKPIDILATFIKSEDIDKMKPIVEQWDREKAKAWPLTREPSKKAAVSSGSKN